MPHPLSNGLPRDFLRPCLLLLLREGPAHGYPLLEQVESFGFDRSDPGALYRALRRLQDEGLVASSWESSDSGPRKRVYRLSRAGLTELDRLAAGLAEGERRVDAFLDRYLRARMLAPESRRFQSLSRRFVAHRSAVRHRGKMLANGDEPPVAGVDT